MSTGDFRWLLARVLLFSGNKIIWQTGEKRSDHRQEQD